MRIRRQRLQHGRGHRRLTLRRSQRSLVAALLFAVLGVVVYGLMLPARVQALGGVPSQTIVISQVYGGAGCGTAGCSTYQNDYIELFNRSKTAISVNGWSVQYAAATGTAWQVTALPNVTIQPGQYFLVAESFGANGVNPLPTPDATGTIAMSATAAKVALVNCTTALTGACPSTVTGACSIIDFVGYGATANCNETANAPAPSTTTADIRNGGGNVDSENNSTDFQALAPTPRNTASTLGTPTAANGEIDGRILTNDGTALGGVVVRLSGTQSRTAITDSSGFYSFSDVETSGFYTVTPSRANYSFGPAERSFTSLSRKTEAAFTATASQQQTSNPLDTNMFFARQQYLDFLGREPDANGLAYWTSELDKCGDDAACLNQRRIGISAAFFIESESQLTGSYIYRLYKGALGRQVSYAEFSADRPQVIGGESLEASRAAFAGQFVQRGEFMQKYSQATSAESFVDDLLMNIRQASGADLTGQRSALIAKYRSASEMNESRALVVREAIDNGAFQSAEYNKAFVTMEYFGYLRRDAEEGGYQFWLNVLDNQEPGNYRGMVCSFITSAEYQERFSSYAGHSNRDCGQ
jgi:hypothetical protein